MAKEQMISGGIKLRQRIAELEAPVKKRKRAEKKARQQSEFLNTILESLSYPFYVIDANDYTILKANSAAGLYQTSETITCYELLHKRSEPCSDKEHPCPLEQVKKTKKPVTTEHLHYDTEGNLKFNEIYAYPIFDNKGNVTQVIECTLDITDRKRAEEALRKSEKRFRELADLLPQTVFEIDEKGHFLFANAYGLESSGYAQEDIDKGLNAFQLFIPEDRERAQENTRRILNGEQSIGNEYTILRKDGSTFPAILYSSPIIHEGKPVPVGLRGIVIDITERKRIGEERQKNFERLRRSLEETVSALASALEMRDPYVAGHQRRVAKLVVAIAEEMGFSDEQIDGIRITSLVHDIGKIYIPSDLLQKTDQLNDIEYELFKSHSLVGYNILKTVDFPWPVAHIVLQHHERQDGSGYPQGLSGEDILLEARILAVADVIDAMSGHRPHRSAYSVGDALEEVIHNKGSLYDPEVVDACLRVFYDKGFTFEEMVKTET